jgi:predicted dienelactone hydrolase
MGDSYNMHKLISLSIIILLLFTPIHAIATQTPEHKSFKKLTTPDPEWNDGRFTGQIYDLQSTENGTITGTLNLGRKSTRGTFYATWTINNQNGHATGLFNNKIILGTIKQPTITPFIGKLTITPCSLTILLIIPLQGIYTVYAHYDASFLYPPSGPYDIGVKTYHFIDESRPENFTVNDPDDLREMMVQLWYPLSTENASYEYQKNLYMDAISFQWLKGRSPIPLFTIPNHANQYVNPYSVQNPPIETIDGPFPVIIFSHGYDGVYQIYTSLIEDLVSHGYIIASINHPYIAGVTVFPDNRTITVSQIPSDPEEAEAWRTLGLRSVVEDAKYVLNILSEWNITDPFYAGTMNLNQIGMYGHSFGGGATAICCYEDTRFKAGLTLDGFSSPESISSGLETPFLMMVTQDRYNNDTILDQIWENLTGNAYLIGIQGSQHYSYTDVGILLQHLLPLVPPKLLGFGTIDQKRMVNITVTIERAFFDVYLRQANPDTLTTILDFYPEITYKLK